MIHHHRQAFIILVLFTVPFYHFLFSRYLDLTKRHFSSDILVPFPDSSDMYSRGKRVKKAFHSKVTVFKEPINSGPYYICVVSNRCLYRRSVCTFKRDKFSAFSDKVFSCVESFDGNFYICMTCGKKLKKNCIPCQAVYNQLELCELPKEFRDIRRLKNYQQQEDIFSKR